MNKGFTWAEKIILFVSFLVLLISLGYLGGRLYMNHTYLAAAFGGTYREAQIGLPSMPNPVFSSQNGVDQDIVALVFAGLTRFDPEKQRVVPDVATDWNLSSDRKKYTFYMNPNTTWHDGEPVTVDDVIFTYEVVLKSPDYQGPYAGIFDGMNIERIDDHTFIFVLDEPEAFFLRDTTIGLLPAHLLSAESVERLESSSFNQKPVGCGPYKLTDISLSEAKFTRHEKYHGKKPYIENVVLNFYPDIFTLQQDRMKIANIKSVPAMVYGDFAADQKFEMEGIELPQYVALFMNTERPLLRHRQVRRAIRSFIDVDKIIDIVQPARKILDPIFVRSTEVEFGSGSYFAPEQGDQMLADLGWKKDDQDRYVTERKNDEDKIEEIPVGLKLLTVDRDDFRMVADMIAAMLDWAGIYTEVDVRSGDQFFGALAARDYDILLYGESVGSDLDFYPFWHSSQSTFPGLNLSQYANLEVDKLLTDVRQTFDGTAQGQILAKVRDKLLEDVPAAWLYTPTYSFVHEPDLRGLNLNGFATLADRLRQLAQDWYLKDQIEWRWGAEK